MASSKKSVDIEIHPLLSHLLAEGGDECVFRGYVGPSDSEASIRLYPSLGNLNFSVEIARKDIVETAPAPTALLPHNGTVVWVRSDAEVVFHGDTVTTVPVRSLRGPRQGAPIDIVRGRLRISVPAQAAAHRQECDVCASCRGCASCTMTCQSGPPHPK
jgi:hypothetical protein